MKNIIIALIFLFLLPFSTLAQDSNLKKLFEKYRNVAGFELEMEDPNLNIDSDGDFDLVNFLDKIEYLFILEFEENEGDVEDLAAFKSKLNKLADKKNFTTMIDIKGEESFIMMLRKNENDQTTDVLMISEEKGEATFIWASSY